jgi:hypothetical protein
MPVDNPMRRTRLDIKAYGLRRTGWEPKSKHPDADGNTGGEPWRRQR